MIPGTEPTKDVEYDVVGPIGEQAEAGEVVGGGLFEGGDLGFAEVDAEGDSAPAGTGLAGEAGGHRGGAAVVEAHPVDDSFLGGIAEHPGLRVARLGVGGDRADLNVAKTERGGGGPGPGILVEAGGEADRVGEG